MTKLILAIDGNNISIRSQMANIRLSHDGVSTGMVFGVVNTLRSLVSVYNPTHLVWFWDNGRSSYRTGIFPGYKSSRKTEGLESRQAGFLMVQEVLSAMRVQTISETNVEADDHIAGLARGLPDDYRMLIVSGDHDLHQLVSSRVMIHDPGKNKIMLERDLLKKHSVPSTSDMSSVWSIMGDSSDSIPGIKGLGPKRSVSLMESFGWDFERVVASFPKDEAEVLRRNKKLIHLDGSIAPHSPEGMEFRKDCCDFLLLSEIFGKWGMESLKSAIVDGGFWSP